MIFNDITARDIQRGEMRSGVFSFCKAIDTFCPLGPWIVTPDEIPDPHDLAMELRVNGEQRQESQHEPHERDDPRDPQQLLRARLQRRRRPLDRHRRRRRGLQVGGGAQRLYLKPGDVVEAEIERIGVLRNPVISWQEGHGEPAPPRIRPWGERHVTWERDDAKLDRVRALMAEEELDALVVRAPDNVLYLTNFWGMKGYDACVFPREGEPVLITIEASEEDAARTAWTEDVRLIRGYDPEDPRPPLARTLEAAVDAARDYERVGLELSLGTQASDRMVGEPTTFTAAWFDAFPDAADATPLLVRARSIKTEQELERLRLANELAAAAMDHVRELLRPGMREAQVAALWQGFVHGEGTGLPRPGRARAPVLPDLGRPRDQDVHRDRRPPRRRGRACPVRDLGLRRRLLGRPHEEPRGRRAQARVRRARDRAHGRLRRRARPHPARVPRWPSSTGRFAQRSPRRAIPASRRTRSATASARGRTSRRIRTRPAAASSRRGWCSRSSPACTGPAAADCASRTTSS